MSDMESRIDTNALIARICELESALRLILAVEEPVEQVYHGNACLSAEMQGVLDKARETLERPEREFERLWRIAENAEMWRRVDEMIVKIRAEERETQQ